jgi:hypothetical protein
MKLKGSKERYLKAKELELDLERDAIDTTRFNHLEDIARALAGAGVTYGEIAQYAAEKDISFNDATEQIYRERF